MSRISLMRAGFVTILAAVAAVCSGCSQGAAGHKAMQRLIPQFRGYLANEKARMNTVRTTFDSYVQEEREGGKDVLDQWNGYVKRQKADCNDFRQTLKRWHDNQ